MVGAGEYKEAADTMTRVSGGLWVPKHTAEEVEEKTSRTRGAKYGVFRRGAAMLRPRNRRSKEGILSYVFEMIFTMIFFSLLGSVGGFVSRGLEKLFNRSKESEQDSDDAGREAEEVGDTAEEIDKDTAEEILRVTRETNEIVKKLAAALGNTNREDDPEAYDACVRAGGQLVDATGECVLNLCQSCDESLEACYDTFIESNKQRAGVSDAMAAAGDCPAPTVVCHTETAPAACPPEQPAPPAPATTVAPPASSAPPVKPVSVDPPVPTPAPAPAPAPASSTPTTSAPPESPQPVRPPAQEKKARLAAAGATTVNVTVNCDCDGDEVVEKSDTRRVVPADAGDEHQREEQRSPVREVTEPPCEHEDRPDEPAETPKPDDDVTPAPSGILAGLLGVGVGIIIAEFLHNNLGDLLTGLTTETTEVPPVEPVAEHKPIPEPAPAPKPEPAPAPAPAPAPVCPTPPPAPSADPAPAGPSVATGAPTSPGVASSTPPPMRHAGGARKAGAW